MKYNFKEIEEKWQEAWDRRKFYVAEDRSSKPKYYVLVEFPYPSGDGLHVGHVRSYTAMDVVARKRRMEGKNVLYPMGWDAFGLPTENYAIKTGTPPDVVTRENTDTFRRQLKSFGYSFDWDREVNTADPNYYRWTQWMFLKFFEHGLAYKSKSAINWCSRCKIGLANEEVIGGACERCGTPVCKRQKEQWMLEITKYADELLTGLNDIDFLPEIKRQQEHWIGKSEGTTIQFPIFDTQFSVNVFTTRPDTLFGATYLVVAPEHELILKLKGIISNFEAVAAYAESACAKTEYDRIAEVREKNGISLDGVMAINPATNKKIPIWVADYVLGSVGTGAIMAVPAHDERDYKFAVSHGLPIRKVIEPVLVRNPIGSAQGAPDAVVVETSCYTGVGELVNSGKFDGMDSERAKWKIAEAVGGKRTVQYRLRDWVFSRQRYWGEPIPLVFCPECKKQLENQQPATNNQNYSKGEIRNPGWVPMPDDKLPVELPMVESYQPRDDGESPLASARKWVHTTCPRCGGPARRETDTMPNWAGSSWYYLAYALGNPKLKTKDQNYWNKELLAYWIPVDWYNGGMEQVTLHLLYSRFWNRFLYDIGEVPVVEPYRKRTAHGLILAAGGVKMSKSRGNVVNPDELVQTHGADALRLYELFIGPFNQAVSWNQRGIVGMRRFLERVWKIGCRMSDATYQIQGAENRKSQTGVERILHQTVKKVTDDIEAMRFNTAVSALMILINEFERTSPNQQQFEIFLKLLNPFAPHIAHELWSLLGNGDFIERQPWPSVDEKELAYFTERVTVIVQVNGKFAFAFPAERGMTENQITERTLGEERVQHRLRGRIVQNTIFKQDQVINFVTE